MRDIYETSIGRPNDKFKIQITIKPAFLPSAFDVEHYEYELYEMSCAYVKELLDLLETLEGMEG